MITRHFVIVEEAERALLAACRCGHAEVVEFTVAPRSTSAEHPWGGHEWLIEFAEPPRAPALFVRTLDETLQQINADYRTTRTAHVGMVTPRVVELPAGTFYRWIRERVALGDQPRVPRVTNDRAVADALLSIVRVRGCSPLIAVGS